jgi:hypothetical protein
MQPHDLQLLVEVMEELMTFTLEGRAGGPCSRASLGRKPGWSSSTRKICR